MEPLDNLEAGMQPLFYYSHAYEYRADGNYQLDAFDAFMVQALSEFNQATHTPLIHVESEAPSTAYPDGRSTWVAYPQQSADLHSSSHVLHGDTQRGAQLSSSLPNDSMFGGPSARASPDQERQLPYQHATMAAPMSMENNWQTGQLDSIIDPALDLSNVFWFGNTDSDASHVKRGFTSNNNNFATPNMQQSTAFTPPSRRTQQAFDESSDRNTSHHAEKRATPETAAFSSPSSVGSDAWNSPYSAGGSTLGEYDPPSLLPTQPTKIVQAPTTVGIPGLTTTLHSFENCGGAKAWFHAGRRKVELRGGPAALQEFKDNQLVWEAKLKTAIATAEVLPTNPTTQDLRNETMRHDFVALVEKKFGSNSARGDEIMSSVAGMIVEEFIRLYEYGSRYFVNPRPSTADPRDELWTPKQRMHLLITTVHECKAVTGGLFSGMDKISELVAAPTSCFDSVYAAKGSNESRGVRTQMKKLELEAAAARLAAGGSLDADSDDESNATSKTKHKAKATPEKKPSTKALESLVAQEPHTQFMPVVPKKEKTPKTNKSTESDENQGLNAAVQHATKTAAKRINRRKLKANSDDQDATTGAEQEPVTPTPMSNTSGSLMYESQHSSRASSVYGNGLTDYAEPEPKRMRF